MLTDKKDEDLQPLGKWNMEWNYEVQEIRKLHALFTCQLCA